MLEHNKEVNENITSITEKFNAALREYVRHSGYIEGSLETLVAMLMNSDPEISLSADRLIKSFRALEGICSQGLEVSFAELRAKYIELEQKYQQVLESKEDPGFDSIEDLAESIKNIEKGNRKKNEK